MMNGDTAWKWWWIVKMIILKTSYLNKTMLFLSSERPSLSQATLDCDCNHSPAYRKAAQMDFDIKFLKQCYSVKHDWRNFNNLSFESIILHEIYRLYYRMIIVIHPKTCLQHSFVLAFRVLFFLGCAVHVWWIEMIQDQNQSWQIVWIPYMV